MTLQQAFWVTLAFIALSAIGMGASYYGFGHFYATPGAMPALLALEVALLGLSLGLLRRFGRSAARLDLGVDRRAAWLLVPSVLVVGAMLTRVALALPASGAVGAVALTALVTALVGFNEEVVFRGFVLESCRKRFGDRGGAILSAVGFSLIHSANVFAGLLFEEMLAQLVLTFVFGLWAALVVLRIGAIWPIILIHAGWDLGLIGANSVAVHHGILPSVHLLWTLLLIPTLWFWPRQAQSRDQT